MRTDSVCVNNGEGGEVLTLRVPLPTPFMRT